jgi:hypothetical protein
MASWTQNELTAIGNADELQLEALKNDGSMRRPVTMWVVRVGDELFVRSANGPSGKWFLATQVQHKGQIRAGGVLRKVNFVAETDAAVNDKIDAAYNSKYGHYNRTFVDPMVTPEIRLSTIKLVPQD